MQLLTVIFSDKGQLSKLLVFVTGLDMIPSLGFDPQPSVTFGHGEDLGVSDLTRMYPTANTCGFKLRIPVLETYEEFAGNMMLALDAPTSFTMM